MFFWYNVRSARINFMADLKQKIKILREKLQKINKNLGEVDELVGKIYESKELSDIESKLNEL